MELRQRKRNRLTGHDYSQPGCYFITICTYNRENFFWTSSVVGADIIRPFHQVLTQYGLIVEQAILDIPRHYTGVEVSQYVVMPNHVHMILTLPPACGRMISAPTKPVPVIIGQMKRYASKECGVPFWQRSFHDHIIRDEAEYLRICAYIETNPARWREDIYYVVPKGEYLL